MLSKCNVLLYGTRTAKPSIKRQEILLPQPQYEHSVFYNSFFHKCFISSLLYCLSVHYTNLLKRGLLTPHMCLCACLRSIVLVTGLLWHYWIVIRGHTLLLLLLVLFTRLCGIQPLHSTALPFVLFRVLEAKHLIYLKEICRIDINPVCIVTQVM